MKKVLVVLNRIIKGTILIVLVKFIILGICLIGSVTFSYQEDEVVLGKLQTGAIFSFVRNPEGEWGIKISGGSTPEIIQIKPAEIQVFQSEDNIIELAAGYKSVNRSGSSINAAANIAYNKNVVFHVIDTWTLNENVVTLQRKVEVEGEAGGGFNSSIGFPVDPSVRWFDLNCMAPGALYGDPTYNGDRPAGGTLNYMARQFLMREDMLPAPLFALAFRNGSSIAMLNPSPNGESTVEETKFTKDLMTDARFQFGTFKIWQTDEDPVEFGYQFPGTTRVYESNPNTPAQPRWVRRFHPIVRGFVHKYNINFRFGNIESFQNLIRDTWRWTWNTLKPAVTPIEVELVRRVLLDHLVVQAATIDGRTAIPFAVATYDTATPQWNWTMAALGFVSKNIECADQFLREGDRDTS